ncbi:MAG: sigma-70 family RNA polymerase sigma factor [Acidobacteriota bacterium]|nr:sigma-70 family RNA polymerase sigma factor [Acidobacteriota bacterium]
MSDVPGDELARAAAAGTLQLTQPHPVQATRREAAVWHDRTVAVKRELAGRTGSRGGDAAARELWIEAESSQAVAGDEADALARRAQSGDEAAREELIQRLLPLVHATARRYRTEGLEQADLLQEGVVGLLRALQRFDPERGVPFAAYATWWIRQSLQEARSDFMRPLRLPPKALRQLSQLKSEHQRIYQDEQRSAKIGELAERTQIALEQAEALLVADARERSLDEAIGSIEGDLGTLGDLLEDPLSAAAYEDVVDAVAGEQLRALLSRLTDREREVIGARFGFDTPAEKLSQVGERLGVSAERVRQIEERALAKLRSAA